MTQPASEPTWAGARQAMRPGGVSTHRKRRRGGSLTRPEMLRARERAGRAYLMRMGGATFQTIADELGYAGRQSAMYAIRVAADRIGNGRARPTELQAERLDIRIATVLDSLLTVHFDAALDGDHRALNCVLAIMDMTAKLHGH